MNELSTDNWEALPPNASKVVYNSVIIIIGKMINKVSIKFVFGFLGILLVGFGVVITAGYLSDNKNIDPEINLANDRI